jgi:hypothetical protein
MACVKLLTTAHLLTCLAELQGQKYAVRLSTTDAVQREIFKGI